VHDKPNILQITARALQQFDGEFLLGLVPDENADDFAHGNFSRHFAINPRNDREFARPVTSVVRPAEPGGLMRFPFGRHREAEFGGCRCIRGLPVRHKVGGA